MRVYLAASYASKLRLRPIRDALFALGYDVQTTWLDEVSKPVGMSQAEFNRKLAIKDMVEAQSAELLIQDTLDPSTSGGRNVEWGLALGRYQRQLMYIVGQRMNVFDELADKQFDTWEEALTWLRQLIRPPSALPKSS